MNPSVITSAISSVANMYTEVFRGVNNLLLARMNSNMQERAYYMQRLQQASGYNLPGSPANAAPTEPQSGGSMEKYFLYAAIGVLLLLLIFKKR